MSESIIADFVGKFNAEVLTRAEPVPGRVLLSQKRLVLAAREDDKLTIPLSAIFDIAIGHVPPDLGDFFESTVTVAFERGGSRHVAAIEASDDKISKFSTVLFKAILNGTETTLQERANVGGRVTDDGFTTAKLYIEPGAVEFRRPDGSFRIALESIIDFERISRTVAGSTRTTLTFRHTMDGIANTTTVALPSPRKLSILARYLRLEYSDRLQELRDVELATDEKQALVAIYSTGGLEAERLAAVVGTDGSRTTILQKLEKLGLVENSSESPSLTREGEVAVCQYFEDVSD